MRRAAVKSLAVGTSSHRVGPAVYISVGVIAVLVAILMATRRGRELLDRDRSAVGRSERRRRPGSATVAKTRARAERRSLNEGSLVVACVVGALLALPGPFDVLALGRLARHGYGLVAATSVMVVFALVNSL